MLWLIAAGVVVALLLISAIVLRKPRWPFKQLQRRGSFKSSGLPADGDALEERKRDFARTKPGLLVVTPTESDPCSWSSTLSNSGDVNKDKVNAAFFELQAWLDTQLSAMRCPSRLQLAQRVVGMVSATEGFRFAMMHKVPPCFPQSKFVLVLGFGGQVRIMWIAFITDEPKPNLTSTPFILKVVSDDLNTEEALKNAEKHGVGMDYVAVPTKATDLEDYLKTKQGAALSRAAVEDCWDDVLGNV